MAPIIYWMSGSAPCWKAMLTLEECGVAYDNKLLSMSKGEQKTPEMLKLNPRGQLPVYVDGDTVVNESLAICLYVGGQNADQKLLPSDGPARAAVLQRFVEASTVRTAIQGMYFMMRTPKEELDQELVKERSGKLVTELELWEKYTAKGYLVGGSLSLADLSMFPHLALLVRMGLQLEKKFPNLQKYYTMMSELPSVKKTWPPEWTGDNKTVLNFIA